MNPTLTQVVKGNRCRFQYYRNGTLFYNVDCVFPEDEEGLKAIEEDPNKAYRIFHYRFPVPIADVAGASLDVEEPAIRLMRWIRLSMENNEFVLLGMTTKID